MKHNTYGIYERIGKRILDATLSSVALILLSPLFLILAILVRTKLGSPVLFRQQRPGKDGKVFTLYKFRTMTDQTDDEGNLLPDEVRLTKFGQLLRSTSLDELPELLNIVRGDMAIVGPRPLLVQYLPLYNDRQGRRHEVRPGLTGYAQVNGRNAISWEEKFEYDVAYVDKITFLMDLRILCLTLKTVVKRDGISGEATVTMEPFQGTKVEANGDKEA